MLKSEVENEKQKKDWKQKLNPTVPGYLLLSINLEQSQKSNRDLQLACQGARDKRFGLWDKMNFDMSNLKDNNEILSQQLSKTESKFNSLKTEFHYTRDAVKGLWF